MTFHLNKRGISPLIATILLIAFAVSIGALIMNLFLTDTSSIKANETQTSEISCSDINIIVTNACRSDSELVVTIQNKGQKVSSLSFSFSDNELTTSYMVPASSIGIGETLPFAVSKDIFNEDIFKVVPNTIFNGENFPCSSKSVNVQQLSTC